jgi:predicted esterase
MESRVRFALATVSLITTCALAQDPSKPSEVAGMPKSQYFLIGARVDMVPAAGNGLLVVLPGGPGSADFLPWVQNGIHAQAPDDFLCAMVVAPKWSEGQKIVWPTAARKETGMKYTTEELVRAVVKDVGKGQKIDPARTVVLCWSSSGPAVWDLLTSTDNPFARAYVAMSIWTNPAKEALARTAKLRLLLDQSPDDKTTTFDHAEKARDALKGAGAVVRLMTYHGGHGWNDNPQPRIREGLRWLLSPEPAPADKTTAVPPPATGKNLLTNGDFEQGSKGWDLIDNSKTSKAEADTKDKKEGKGSLHLTKTGKMPMDLLRQDVQLPDDATRVTARAWVKSKEAGNAFVKFFLFDKDDKVVHEDVDLVQLRGSQDWQKVEKTWERKDATHGALQVVLVMGGEVWIDAAEVLAGK